MGHLETPANGAALDVSYISQIVTAINDLNNELGNRGKQSRIVDNVSTAVPKLKVPTSQLSIVTGRKKVSTDQNSKTNDVIRGTFFFSQNFLYPPVVTATPETKADGIKNNTLGVSVILTEVSENKANFSVIFNSDSGKKLDINVNFIAIGVSAGQTL